MDGKGKQKSELLVAHNSEVHVEDSHLYGYATRDIIIEADNSQIKPI